MNRLTVETGIARLTSEVTQHQLAIESLQATLGELDRLYSELCELHDVHGEGDGQEIARLSTQRTEVRRQVAEHETAIADLEKRLQVARQALTKVDYEERLQELQDLTTHSGVVKRRYNSAVVELVEANAEARNYRQRMVTLRRQVEDYCRTNQLPVPSIGALAVEPFRDAWLTANVGLDYVREKFPVDINE